MQKKLSHRLLRPIEFGCVVLLGATLLGLIGCDDSSPLSSDKKITAFSITLQKDGTPIDGTVIEERKEITVTIPAASDDLNLAWIAPTVKISDKAVVSPASGEAQDFSKGPVSYTVTAADGSTQDYQVSVTVNGADNQILTFKIDDKVGKVTNQLVTVENLPLKTDLSALVPIITVSPGATIEPPSGMVQDFSKGPVVYTVKSLNGKSQDYRVVVSLEGKSSVNTIKSITFNGVTKSAAPFAFNTTDTGFGEGYDITRLSPVIELDSEFATVSPASGTAQDFTSSVVYTVTAQNGATRDYAVTVKRSSAKAVSSVKIGSAEETSATSNIFTFADKMPAGTDITALRPTLAISDKAKVTPASGSVQDFTNPVVYTVTAEDGTSVDYTVIVTLNNDRTIHSFKLPGASGTPVTVTPDSNIITFKGTDLPKNLKLTPTIEVNAKATITPASGIQQDFTEPVKYTVTAQDGTKQDYTVNVVLDTKTLITSFKINNTLGTIDADTNVITFTKELSRNTSVDITKLIPTIVLEEPRSTVEPLSGIAQDFSNPVKYTVTAQDGTKQNYTVVVEKSSDTSIDSFKIKDIEGTRVSGTNIIEFDAVLAVGTDVTKLTPVIVLGYPRSSISPISGMQQDFTNPVAYTVTAQDGTKQNYTVVVKKRSGTVLGGLTFEGLTTAPIEEDGLGNFTKTFPKGTNVSRLIPKFATLSEGATVYPASGQAQDFTSGSVTYTVTAEDGSTQRYKVTVEVDNQDAEVKIVLAGAQKTIDIYSSPKFEEDASGNKTVNLSLSGLYGTKTKEAVVSLQVFDEATGKYLIGSTTGSSTGWYITGWQVDGNTYNPATINTGTANIITLKAGNYFIGRHVVKFDVTINGKPYSERFYFTVDK